MKKLSIEFLYPVESLFSIICILLIGWLGLTACASPVSADDSTASLVKPTLTSTARVSTPEREIPSTPTSQIATPQPTSSPAILSFPSPGPEPVSDWRPPLYEIPLALNPNDHFYFARPIAVNSVNWPLQDYRYGYVYPRLESMHTGSDIVVPLHTPVLAAAEGKVVFAGYGLLNGGNDKDDPYGIAVVIRHGFSFQNRTVLSVYAHLEKTTVKVGDYVKQGDQVGNVGMTGATSGPHLHFEIRLEDGDEFLTQNPELWMAPPVGYGVLTGRIMNTFGSLMGETEVWVRSLETNKKITIYTYTTRMTHVDPYYKENLVLGDLPAGDYEISFYYYGRLQKQQITIHPAAVNYFQFQGSRGFTIGDPPLSAANDFLKPLQ